MYLTVGVTLIVSAILAVPVTAMYAREVQKQISAARPESAAGWLSSLAGPLVFLFYLLAVAATAFLFTQEVWNRFDSLSLMAKLPRLAPMAIIPFLYGLGAGYLPSTIPDPEARGGYAALVRMVRPLMLALGSIASCLLILCWH